MISAKSVMMVTSFQVTRVPSVASTRAVGTASSMRVSRSVTMAMMLTLTSALRAVSAPAAETAWFSEALRSVMMVTMRAGMTAHLCVPSRGVEMGSCSLEKSVMTETEMMETSVRSSVASLAVEMALLSEG